MFEEVAVQSELQIELTKKKATFCNVSEADYRDYKRKVALANFGRTSKEFVALQRDTKISTVKY